MTTHTVRRAQKNDGEEVARLWQALLHEQEQVDARFRAAEDAVERWLNDYPLWIQDETRRIFVAEAGDDIVGFITAQRYGPPPIYEDSAEVFVDEVYVTPSRRGQRIGAELVEAVREWANELHADRLRLRCLAANERARTFWQKHEATPFFTTMTIELAMDDQEDREPQKEKGRLGF